MFLNYWSKSNKFNGSSTKYNHVQGLSTLFLYYLKHIYEPLITQALFNLCNVM